MTTLHATVQALGALGVCAAVTVCTLCVTKSTAQSAKEAQPQAGRDLERIPIILKHSRHGGENLSTHRR